jgi:hypothetical protein
MDVLLGVIVCLHQNISVEQQGKAHRQGIRGTVFPNMRANLYPWKYRKWDLFYNMNQRGVKMRKLVFFVTVSGLAFVLIFGFEYGWSQSTKTQMSENGNLALNDYASPPGSLSGLYPPYKKEPVYLFKMFELGKFFSGTGSAIPENKPIHMLRTYISGDSEIEYKDLALKITLF